MYNLLMSGGSETWDHGAAELEYDRFLEHTDDEIRAEYRELTPAAIAKIKLFPALFTFEKGTSAPSRIGKITDLQRYGKSLHIRFVVYPEFSLSAATIEQNYDALCIRHGNKHLEQYRTHWAIKPRDLFELGLLKPAAPVPTLTNRIFVVHGHDAQLKTDVAKHLAQLGLQPVILQDEADQGRTVIEKFEAHADVGFAVVLMTPDDQMANSATRARQNVVLEFGYFFGKLGRHRICVLKKGHLEMPSDIFGIITKNVDGAGAWKAELTKELLAAGYNVQQRAVPAVPWGS